MPTTSLAKKTSAHPKDRPGGIPDTLADDLVRAILNGGKPVTVWEVAAGLGDNYAEQAAAVLDELTAEGILVRFRGGLNNYYATPKVALTEEEPALRAIMSDSLKRLLLLWRYKVTGKLGGANTYCRSA